MEELPVILSKLFDVPKHGSSSFKPIKLERGGHLIIVKHKENSSSKRMNEVIDSSISEFDDADC